MKYVKTQLILLLSFALTFSSFFLTSEASALDCGEIQKGVKSFLANHLRFRKFDNKLSERVFDKFMESLDPGKMYFLQKDYDKLSKKFRHKIDEFVNKKKCHTMDEIIDLYDKRFSTVFSLLKGLIEKKHDFSIDEHIKTDRDKISYAKDKDEQKERWRKWVKYQILLLKGTADDMKTVRKKMHKRYELLKKRNDEMDSEDVMGIFLSSFASSLDPHSDYFSRDELEDFRIRTRLSLEGIGAVLRSEEGFTIIQSLVPGGAAEKAGTVNVQDKIIAVAQENGEAVDIVDMDLREVVKLIRGKSDTKVHLTLLRETGEKSEKLVVTIVRKKIELKDQAVKYEVHELQAKTSKSSKLTYRIGVIDLPSFYIDFQGRRYDQNNYTSSSRDLKKALRELNKKDVDAIILDMRNNGGGSLDEAVAISGMFLEGKGCPIVASKQLSSKPRIYRDPDDGIEYKGALVVMINRYSASGSEIVAGAMKDYGRALIVGGDHTFGKGTVQNLMDVKGFSGALKVTISKFYLPAGASTQERGVNADVVITSFANMVEVGERYLDNALTWRQISPYKKEACSFKKQLAEGKLDLIKKESAKHC